MERFPFFIFSSTCLFFISKFSVAVDTISPNQTITGSQTLVSAGEIFELGFFSRGSSNKRYLGIWFKRILPQTVVWVANRNNPLTNSSGALTIGLDGNIVLLNQTETVIWSSNSSSVPKNPVAQLLDSGNLVLRDGSSGINPEIYSWQSFDYPFDTLLPGMKVGANLRSGQIWYLTSWKSEDDPSPGDYTYKIDYRGLPQKVLCKGSDVQFRSEPWDWVGSGLPELYKNSLFNPIFVFNEEEVYYSFENINKSAISRFVVNQSGSVQHISWNDRRLEWVVMMTLRKDNCDDYDICGAYGICNINNAQNCKCLKGFTPRSPVDYNALDWAGGCVPGSPRKCGSEEGFRKFTDTKLPDTSTFNRSMSSMDCEAACLNNCSCVGYARTGILGCVFWFGDLLDIREYSEGGRDLYIRMAASELDSKNNGKPVAVIVAGSVVSGLLLFVFISCFTCLFFVSKFSIAIDTISPNQTITGGQTLVSAGKIFELGFFSRGTPNKRYLGIWFKSILPQTVVWVANRNTPLTNSSGAITIGRDGNIVLLNQTETVIWSSNSSSVPKNPVAQLLDSGNLVLREGSNPKSYLWQSFDYPFDTLLPGMKLGANLKRGQNWYLRSWKSEDDPSPGDYTYKIDYRGLPQIVHRKGSEVRFRSEPWDWIGSGFPELYRNPLMNTIFVFNEEEVYYSFENINKSAISRRLEWVVMMTLRKDNCDDYAICGAYGICNINNAQNCKCLKGFTPRSPVDYNALDWTGGCVPGSPRKCRSEEGFRKFTDIKLPDTSSYNRSMSSMDCEAACLNNCSCVAYAKTGNLGCAFWFGDLLDIKEYEGGRELYIRMAASELDSKNNGKSVAVIVAVSAVSGLLLFVFISWNTYELKLFQAWKLWNEEKPLELIDAFMEDPVPEFESLKCIHVGLLCVQKRPNDRPTMPTVLLMLDSENVVLPQPKQPGFYTERFPVEKDSSSSIVKKTSTLNDVTVTMLEGR
ncbi:hypothetical protein HHK36_002027 [Tetracentron sinense]|uniref:Receptor-like serine/threonine-protein kinase n=1 Tax=Tetracentron sinense TaxID=13715 RepID=A0A835DRL3_TETSI|nr:hypothetical protein HHK36_002027 [Tetracentron sinense]